MDIFKFVLNAAFPAIANKAAIQVRESGNWQTVQEVEDKQNLIIYAFNHALENNPGKEIRALRRNGRIAISPTYAPGSRDLCNADKKSQIQADLNAAIIELMESLQEARAAGAITEGEFQVKMAANLKLLKDQSTKS